MSQEPGWITKTDAAARLGVDERTIERRARAGRISAKARPGFPTLYLAADVETLAQTASGEVRTGLLEPVTPGPSNGHGAVASLRPRSSSFEEVLTDLLQAAHRAFSHGATGPTGPTDAATGPTRRRPTVDELPSYVPLDLAMAYSGLSERKLRRMIRQGVLTAIRDDRQWKIHKKDVVALG